MKRMSITELRRKIKSITQGELIVITKYGSPTHVMVPVGVLENGLVANLERDALVENLERGILAANLERGIAMMMEYKENIIKELKENQ